MLKKISLFLILGILISMFSPVSYAEEVPTADVLKVIVDNANESIAISGQATPSEQTIYIDITSSNGVAVYYKCTTNSLSDGTFSTNVSFADLKAPAGTYTVWAYNKTNDYRAKGQLDYTPTYTPTPTVTPTKAPDYFNLIATYIADNSLTLNGTLSLGGGYLINFSVRNSNGLEVFKDQFKTQSSNYSYETYVQLKPDKYTCVASVEGTSLKATFSFLSKYFTTPTPVPTPTPVVTPTDTFFFSAYYKYNLTLRCETSLGKGYLVDLEVLDSNSNVLFKGQTETGENGICSVTVDLLLQPENDYTANASIVGTELNRSTPIIVKPLIPSPTPLPPVINGGTLEKANQYGWFNTDVTVHFTGYDPNPSYKINFLTPDTILTGETKGTIVYGSIKSSSGQTSKTSVSGIKIDKTPPMIEGYIVQKANSYGWYNADVDVAYKTSDNLSGIQTVSPLKPKSKEAGEKITREGYGITSKGTAVDYAGNVSEYTVSNINIDKTSPTVEGQILNSPNEYGWYNGDVTVHYEAFDALSGIADVTPDQIISDEGIDLSSTGSASDKAGNVSGCAVSNINIDKTNPSVEGQILTVPNENGWYNGDVTVHYEGFDALSGIANVTPDQIVSDEGIDLSSTGSASDKAGNASSTSVSGINIDRTAPEIQVSYPQDGAEYVLNEDIKAEYACNDTLSGVSQISSTSLNGANIDTSSVGMKTFNIKVIDKAGNESEKTVTYYVRYKFSGLLNPFNPDNTSFKSSRALPLAFTLTDKLGNNIENAVADLYIAQVVDEIESEEIKVEAVNGRDAFVYDPDSKEYKFVLKLKDLSIGTWRLKIKMDDLSVHSYDITVY